MEHIKKSQGNSAVDDYLVERCKFTLEHGDRYKARELVQRVIGHTQNARPEIATFLAQSFQKDQLFTEAYRYYFKERNHEAIVVCLEQIMKESYPSEWDLFYAKAAIDMLQRTEQLAKVEYIVTRGIQKCGETPTLFFVQMLMTFVKEKRLDLVKKMCNEDMKPIMQRDTVFEDKIDKICQKWCGEGIKPVNPMQAMMANMFGGKK